MKPRIRMLANELTSDDKKILLEAPKKIPALRKYPSSTLQLMYCRGIKTAEEMLFFLEAGLNNLENASLMHDADKFDEIVHEAITNNEHIVFYTDYDMDGIGSGVTGVKGLRNYAKLQNSTSKIDWYANSRFIEGYGITPKGVEDLVSKFPTVKLIITTDNGIVGFDGVQKAKDLGLKIIVTDHHEPSKDGKMVNADAIIDPKIPNNGTNTQLCGAGVIFKLLMNLYYNHIDEWEQVFNLIDVVGLSTVADMVPLTGDNRILVKESILQVYKEENPCFRILREAYNDSCQTDSAKILEIDEEVFGFTYGPAFNSLGRVNGVIDLAMEFLLGEDEIRMREIADEIFATNKIRKVMTEEAIDLMTSTIDTLYPTENDLPPVIALENDTISEGVIGLVASHIKDKYYRPTIIFTTSEKTIVENGQEKKVKTYKGSARSITGIDICSVLDEVKKQGKILGFGGHEMAAGLSIDTNKLEEFQKVACDYVKNNTTPADFIPEVCVDFAYPVADINLDLIDEINVAAPFGMNFEKPMIGITDFVLDKRQYKEQKWDSVFCGANKQTLRMLDQTGLNVLLFKHRYRFDDILARIPNAEQYNLIKLKPIGHPRKSYNSWNQSWKADFLVENDYLFDENFN